MVYAGISSCQGSIERANGITVYVNNIHAVLRAYTVCMALVKTKI
jgi:hypothetical protein